MDETRAGLGVELDSDKSPDFHRHSITPQREAAK